MTKASKMRALCFFESQDVAHTGAGVGFFEVREATQKGSGRSIRSDRNVVSESYTYMNI